MSQITVQQAIDEAIAEEMRLDSRVVMFGEGVATKRKHLVEEFGGKRAVSILVFAGEVAEDLGLVSDFLPDAGRFAAFSQVQVIDP